MFADLVIDRLSALGLSTEVIALAQGMLLGDKSMIDPDVISSFRTSGMSHLLAVSGLHVGIIMAIVWAMLRPLEALVGLVTKPRMSAYYTMGVVKRLAVIAITCLYVWIIGAPTSAVRAAFMLSLCLVGWMLHRPSLTWNCLVLSALVLLAADPWYITQAGFQLSFLAVSGILLFQPWLQCESYPRWFRLMLLSFAAQILTMPIVAYWFHQVPFFGWLQGFLAVPLVPLFVTGLLVGCMLPSVHWLVVPIEALYGWITWVAQKIGQLEQLILGGHLYLYPSKVEVCVAETAIVVLIILMRSRFVPAKDPEP